VGKRMTGTVSRTLRIHLWTLPRWFAAPFFALSTLMGAVLAGGPTGNSWLGIISLLFIMAGANSFNSFLDYAWTHLDKGTPDTRSREKIYTSAQNLVARGEVSLKAIVVNALTWYALALGVLVYLAFQSGWPVLVPGCLGMLITFWYSKGKFNWTHELALWAGVGPISALVGMLATSPSADWVSGILGGVPFGVVLSFCGLALDEWPDAEADLKKGVKSLIHTMWEYGISLEWYLTAWFSFLLLYQVLLITLRIYKPLTAITFLTWPVFVACVVFLKRDSSKATRALVLLAVLYGGMLTAGQIWG
jgi:1,4-dihydroxy-2-naphthoate octaprenyltransferase